jgi:rapamycin-insensitive companion of mTOR
MGLEAEIKRAKKSADEDRKGRLSMLFQSANDRSLSQQRAAEEAESGPDPESESPSFVLAEILQALEYQGFKSDYYIDRANALVELFKRHPTLKYDLAWEIFGSRVQSMLLSDSREVIAAGYRVARYAITDVKSLQIIRSLHTDYLVITSLLKEGKASVEREQALKFVRAFLDVKGGVKEISKAVIRIIVAVAEHADDRLKSISILTLAEILIRDPPRLVEAGGIGPLADALADGSYHAADSLAGAFLYLLDLPKRRQFLRHGHELEGPFAAFSDAPVHMMSEERLKGNAKVVAILLKSWPGLITLSANDFQAIRALISSLHLPSPDVRNILLELLFDILRIKPPSWSSSFLAGRRLTTYGRVTNLKAQSVAATASSESDDLQQRRSLVDHFTTVILVVLLQSGLLEGLLHAEEEPLNMTLKRKTTLLLGEVLKMSSELLPGSWSAKIQLLPQLLQSATKFGCDERFIATATIYQIDSVNRTLYRSGGSSYHTLKSGGIQDILEPAKKETTKTQLPITMDETQFRALMLDTQVLNTVNFSKWRWDLIERIVEGPLKNPKRLDEAIKATKFIHRVLGFYRPFKWRFSDVKNTKPNQRYVRIGCALIKTLLINPEGVRYLGESKFLRQLAECLSHFDPMSGLTSTTPLFTIDRLAETLTGGYFALLGAVGSDLKGVQILQRWKVFNMFYHIIELRQRDDLIVALLGSMDYTLNGHARNLLNKAMTSCSEEIRIFATSLLRKYATKPIQRPEHGAGRLGVARWAIRLLVTQLYDPKVEVSEVAIKILEEACNQKQSLEYVVKCQPALDHLGEIGAPLLLRFLSTSVGYHYLHGLDYITKEMDDWFLGRNDSYVALVEASLARAMSDIPDKPATLFSNDDTIENQDYGLVPPHFYRELTRTKEGCKLLEGKGHFDEFVANIQDFGMEDGDPETILKVKGCLWAVGNVGSMELGAPFLEKSDVVKHIVQIAETSEVMSLRGTAFFVLGLISRSLHGQEILYEHGWDGTTNIMGDSLGFCIPLDFQKLFAVRPWGARSTQFNLRGKTVVKTVGEDEEPVTASILRWVTDLGNTVLAKKAANELNM